jgi:hypothetical protein
MTARAAGEAVEYLLFEVQEARRVVVIVVRGGALYLDLGALA